MKPLVLGDKIAKFPIVQGGMGVGVSLSSLAGAVARAGGIGVISTAQIGFNEPDFKTNTKEANIRALKAHIAAAKEKVTDGLVGVNVMVALKDFEEHVRTAAKAGADVIICGAGLPLQLPEFVKGTAAKIAPIVSSTRAAGIILKMWDKKYNRVPDMIVIEGPKAGGHLGFSKEDVELDKDKKLPFDEEVLNICSLVNEYGERYKKEIPIVLGGGIFDSKDVKKALDMGVAGVQVGTRFVATEECDASAAYKKAYLEASENDVRIIKSPVGLPGRAINNSFLEIASKEGCPVKKCFGCLAKCKPAQIPYCITDALIKAVKGDVDNGLIFCGANVGKINEITTVNDLMSELVSEI